MFGPGRVNPVHLMQLNAPEARVPLDEIRVDAKLNFMEDLVEILEREFKKLKRSRIAIVKILYHVDGGDFVKNYGDLWFIVINNPFWKSGWVRLPSICVIIGADGYAYPGEVKEEFDVLKQEENVATIDDDVEPGYTIMLRGIEGSQIWYASIMEVHRMDITFNTAKILVLPVLMLLLIRRVGSPLECCSLNVPAAGINDRLATV
ncbi:hypothetical protein Tco_0556038 [Tanacetum coccineum]